MFEGPGPDKAAGAAVGAILEIASNEVGEWRKSFRRCLDFERFPPLFHLRNRSIYNGELSLLLHG